MSLRWQLFIFMRNDAIALKNYLFQAGPQTARLYQRSSSFWRGPRSLLQKCAPSFVRRIRRPEFLKNFFLILNFPLTLGSASCVSGCRPSPFTWLCAATRCTRVVDFTWKLEIKKYNFKGWKIHLINFDEVGARLSRRGRSRITAVHFWSWICGFLFGKMEEKNRKIWQENANSEKNGLDSKFVAHICGRSLGGALCTIGAWRVRLQFESIPPTNPLASLFSVSVSSAFLWPLLIFQHIPPLFLPPAVCLLYSPLFSLHFPIFVAIR